MGSSGVGVGEGVGVLVLRSPRSVLAFEGSPAGDLPARAGALVVVLQVGGALFIFDPGVSGLVVQFPLDANLGLAVVNEVSLDWGSVRSVPISCV